MGLFKKSCWSCSAKIDKGDEYFENKKAFCSEEHAKSYKKACEKQGGGGGCCG